MKNEKITIEMKQLLRQHDNLINNKENTISILKSINLQITNNAKKLLQAWKSDFIIDHWCKVDIGKGKPNKTWYFLNVHESEFVILSDSGGTIVVNSKFYKTLTKKQQENFDKEIIKKFHVEEVNLQTHFILW